MGRQEVLEIPQSGPLHLRLPESPSLTIAAAILDPRVAVMTSAEVGVSLVTEFTSARCCPVSVALVVAVSGGARRLSS